MAADVYGVLKQTELPLGWDYALTEDGRVFFVSDKDKTTSWCSPVTGDPIQSGHLASLGLPRGWELGYTPDGIRYYIDHNTGSTTFTNPTTGRVEAAALPSSPRALPQAQLTGAHSPGAGSPNTKFLTTSPITSSKHKAASEKTPQRKHLIKRSSSTKKKLEGPTAKHRDLDAPVAMKGWLYKWESNGAGIRSWKHRYFVLSDFWLYAYKDSREESILSSILLPSYKVKTCPEFKTNKKYVFMTEHANMKTHYFASDHKEDMDKWMKALNLASLIQRDPFAEQEYNRTEGDGTDSPFVAAQYERSMDKPLSPDLRYLPGYPSPHSMRSPDPRFPSPDQRFASPDMRFMPTEQRHRSPKVRGFNDDGTPGSPRFQHISTNGYSSDWQYPSDMPDHHQHRPLQASNSLNGPPRPDAMQRRHSEYNVTPEFSISYRNGVDGRSPGRPQSQYTGQVGSQYPDNRPVNAYPVSYPGQHSDLRTPYDNSTPGPYVDSRPVASKGYQYADSGPPAHMPVHSQLYKPPMPVYNISNNSNNIEPMGAHEQPNSSPYSQAANYSVPVRGEPRTPTSVVNPPWKRENAQTPTYRPPLYENVQEAARDAQYQEYPGRPPLPGSSRDAFVRHLAYQSTTPVRQDLLQATHNSMKRLSEPLVFQFPEGNQQGHGYQETPIKFEHHNAYRDPPSAPHNVGVKCEKQYHTSQKLVRYQDYDTISRTLTNQRSSSDISRRESAATSNTPTECTNKPERSKNNSLEMGYTGREYVCKPYNDKWKLNGVSSENSPSRKQQGVLLGKSRQHHSPDYAVVSESGKRMTESKDRMHMGPLTSPATRQTELITLTVNTESIETQSYSAESGSYTPRKVDDTPTSSTISRRSRPVERMESARQILITDINTTSRSFTHDRRLPHKINGQMQKRSKSQPREPTPQRHSLPKLQNAVGSLSLYSTSSLTSISKSQDQHTFKPPARVITHGSLMADDLAGKSQEELTLLLIELRREESQLNSSISIANQRLDRAQYELNRQQTRGAPTEAIRRDIYNLQDYIESTGNQLDLHRPLIHLVDNLVKMASRHGTRNSDMAHTHSESGELQNRIAKSPGELSRPRDSLPVKLRDLEKSDQDVKAQSTIVNKLSDNLRRLEHSLNGLVTDLNTKTFPMHELNGLLELRQRMEDELLSLRKQLSEATGRLELMSSQNSHLREEVLRIQNHVNGMQKSRSLHALDSSSSARYLESDVMRTQDVMSGLQRQNKTLSATMSALRPNNGRGGAYYETDVDTMKTRDISIHNQNKKPETHGDPIYGQINKPRNLREMKRGKDNSNPHLRGPPPPYKRPQSQIILPTHQQHHEASPNRKMERVVPGRAEPPTPAKKPAALRGKAQDRRKANKARYLTISSSEPLALEARNLAKGPPNSFNRVQDDINLMRGDRDFTTDVIDSQLLAPQKVHIPERYVPDSSDEELELSPEEKQRRAEKAEQIRKLVASQSLQEFTRSEMNDTPDDKLRSKLSEEKKRRELVLEMRHAMALEVTKKSKEDRTVQKMRSKSHENLSRHTENY